jgi:exosortase
MTALLGETMSERRRQEPAGQSAGNAVAGGENALARTLSAALRPQGLPFLAAAAVLTAAFAWSYWPTLLGLVATWSREPDYSHGFLVLPAALYLLWERRERFPGLSGCIHWGGASLIVASLAVRVVGARYYLDPVDGWSILLWLAGLVWLFGGPRVLRWSWPAIAFLLFMVPLPYRIETGMSHQLQSIATNMSAWVLQCLGQPALAEGNVILIGDLAPLQVAEACSGLKIFVGIMALAVACVILIRRAWWERAILLASALPIALVANTTRIAVTGLLYQYVSDEAAQAFTHNWVGYVMIVYAAGLFAVLLWFMGKLVREVEVVEVGTVLQRRRRRIRA